MNSAKNSFNQLYADVRTLLDKLGASYEPELRGRILADLAELKAQIDDLPEPAIDSLLFD